MVYELYSCSVVAPVEHHPKFASQYVEMAALGSDSDEQLELFGEVTSLLNALEEYNLCFGFRTCGSSTRAEARNSQS